MPLTSQQFATRLTSSGLMSETDLQEWLTSLDRTPEDGEAFARALVKSRKLTRFQAEQIYAGREKTLRLGNYVVLDKLGQGGMGLVLKAMHQRMERIVAIKVMSPAGMKSPGAVQRFQREVKAAAKLSHPNIVAAFDADEANGTHFLVMEYVEGTDLAALVRNQGPLPIEQAVSCIIQAARGLSYAHQMGVIHRDIKPANLLMDPRGTVRILDMGLARLEGSVGGSSEGAELTSTGTIMGTVDFMSPEQAMDTKHADAKSDIYSLGCSLFYLVTGRVIYNGDTMMKKLMAHQRAPVPSLHELMTETGERKLIGNSGSLDPQMSALNAVFQRMVAKRPEDRQQSMDVVIEELERYTSAASSAGVPLVSVRDESDEALQSFLKGISGGPGSQTATDRSAMKTANAPSNTAAVKVRATVDTVVLTSGQQSTDPETQNSISADHKKMLAAAGRRSGKVGPPKKLFMAAGAAFLFILLLFGMWVIIRDKDGKEIARIQVPEGGSVTVQPDAGTSGDAGLSGTGSISDQRKAELMIRPVNPQPPTGIPGQGRSPVVPAQPGTGAASSASTEWKSLFDGASLTGWRGLISEPIPAGWEVRDGAILATGGKTYIATTEEFTDFELEFEWKVEPEANGGVYYCWSGRTASLGGNHTLPVGIEYQLTDNPGTADGRRPITATASMYSLYAPSEDATNPTGEWNLSRIVVRGAEIEHWLNGKQVLVCTRGSDEWNERVSRLRSDRNPEFSGPAPGRIVLQSNNGNVWHRNLRIRTPSSSAGTASPSGGSPRVGRQPGEVRDDNALKLKLVWCPPGTFTMGSPESEPERNPENEAQTQVTLTHGFWIGQTEVTQGQWRAVMSTEPWKGQTSARDGANYAANYVSWVDASEYCRRLTDTERQAGRLPANWEYALPTEAQWEYACRAGTTTVFSFGDDAGRLGDYAWFSENARDVNRKYAHEVGLKEANPWGLHDIHGNLWEWCRDSQTNRLPGGTDPLVSQSGRNRVFRGGCWDFLAKGCRSAARGAANQTIHAGFIGFRLTLGPVRDSTAVSSNETEPRR